MKITRHLHLLFLCQILYWTTVIVGITLASLVGAQLAPSMDLATLPIAVLTVGNIISAYPLSLIMQRFGRRVGFSFGAFCGCLGGLIACYSIYTLSFLSFCIGNALLGVAQASALYYRLAATDGVANESRGKAMAWVMSGGIGAAIVAPSLAVWSKDLLLPHLFAGSYALVLALNLIAALLCLGLVSAPSKATDHKKSGRPLKAIISQPTFITAISNTAISHAIMVLIMVATPLAMLACGHTISDASHVIQWHVLGMFIPSFFCGRLIDHFGAPVMSIWGIFTLTASMVIAITGVSLWHFYGSLFLLGIGWNFMYTSGSTMVTYSHTPEEAGKVQGIAEVIISTLAAIAAFSSGILLNQYGWEEVSMGSFPLLAVALLLTLWFKFSASTKTTDKPL